MNYKKLDDAVKRDQERREKAERERSTLMQATRILGVFGFMVILPMVAGAYIGHWLDGLAEGYSVRWTVGMIILGLVIGGYNAYLSLRN